MAIIKRLVNNMKCQECQTQCEYDNLSISKYNKHFDELDIKERNSIEETIDSGA